MKRLPLALVAIVVGVVVSSCAVGVRDPATEITQTSATLNGKVLSTSGGPGSWYIEYGPTEARAETTPTRTIDFETDEIEPVSEPVDGLEPSTVYHYAVCAEDGENPGEAFCSPDQTFRTLSNIQITLVRDCSSYPPSHGVTPSVSGLPPNVQFQGGLVWPSLGSQGATFQTDGNGNFSAGSFFDPVAGTWTATVGFEGQSVSESLFVDCDEPAPST